MNIKGSLLKKFIKIGIVIGATGLLLLFISRFLFSKIETIYSTHVPPKLSKIIINNQKMPPASEELKNTYLPAWKALFMEQNNISDEYFSKHIKVEYVSIITWNQGEALSIHYLITVDWAWVRMRDGILIKPKGANIYLSTEEVRQQSTWNQIANFKPIESIVSYGTAITNLKNQCLIGLTKPSDNPFLVEREGELLLEAGVAINYNENKCRKGQVRPSDGKVTSCSDRPCTIT